MQENQTQANRVAWNTKAYDAWVRAYGPPSVLAEELKKHHKHHLRRWLKYTGDPSGRRIINLLGSTGRKGISLALLGADVTIVDLSQENQRYAQEVAHCAGVHIEYINADVLNIPNEEKLRNFDIVLMEFGILHYFSDLNPVFSVVNRLLRTQGRLILTDFHPFARKLLSDKDNRVELKQDGDYFNESLSDGPVPYAQFLPEEDRLGLSNCVLRSWTVGEILSALAENGMYLRAFEEEPNSIDPRYPAFYTAVADKIESDLHPLYP